MTLPEPGAVADLLRLPSVLSVPGDVLLGTTTSGSKERPLRVAGRIAASSCLYLAGMALNDYADREVDAVDRPGRPIPSGRVTPGFAFKLAAGMTVAGLGFASAAGGRRLLGIAAPLATTVWAYDLAAKKTLWGPPTMAAARSLDVLMGAAGALNQRSLWLSSGVVGGHTFLVTLVSRKESCGGGPELALGALAGTAAVAAAARAVCRRDLAGTRSDTLAGQVDLAVSTGLLGAYAASLGRAELSAIRRPDATSLQRVVGTGVLGIMPLEAGMLAASGKIGRALGVAAGWPLARRLARKRSVT